MVESNQSRPVGPNELRCIARQSLDLYRGLLVGGIFNVDDANKNKVESHLRHAIRYCVSKHPILSAVIENEDTQSARFSKPATLSMRDHLWMRDAEHGPIVDDAGLEQVLEQVHDTRLLDRAKIPPWRVVVHTDKREQANSSKGKARYLILLCYYHSHGDGMAGIAFTRTLVEGLNQATASTVPADSEDVFKPTDLPFLPPLEKAANLTISWSFLLSPLLGAYLPGFIADFFGFRASALPKAGDHWAGQRIIDPEGLVTGTKILSIPGSQVQQLLQACRQRNCRLTGLIHQLVVRALSELVPSDTPANCFVTQSAVDLRRNIDVLSDDDMALCVTGFYETIPRATKEYWAGWTTGDETHPVWAAVKTTTDGLAKTASTLHDQPTGLLRYLSDMRGWTLGQIGKPRECTYELSNLRAFDAPEKEGDVWKVESMIFSQPANMAGGCFDVNVVSKKGGELTVILSWQLGASAVADEKGFMRRLCGSIQQYVTELTSAA